MTEPPDETWHPSGRERKADTKSSVKNRKATKKILIFDDDELVLDSLTILLKKHHYDVVTSLNGFEALEMLDEEPFDMIIGDIKMPGISGVETIKALKETGRIESNREIPVIFMTGYADHDAEKAAKRFKLLAFLHKPFDDSQVLHLLKIHLGE